MLSFTTHTSAVNEALKHGGLDHDAHVNIDWVDSESITEENVAERTKNADGILVPGGFGTRGIEGKIAAAKYAREKASFRILVFASDFR